MDVCYREAKVEDAAGIAHVEVVSQQFGYRGFLPAAHLDGMSTDDKQQRWKSALQSDDSDRTFVAAYNEKVIGFVRAGKTKDSGVGGITYLFVLPEYWGNGIGQVLMSRATKIMLDFDCVSAKLYVYRENTRGRRFYERLGWKLDGRTYDHEFDGEIFQLLCYMQTFEAEAKGVNQVTD